jgi:hypothetical protein
MKGSGLRILLLGYHPVRLAAKRTRFTHSQRGIEIAPYTPVLSKLLALRYINLKQYPEAKKDFGTLCKSLSGRRFHARLVSQSATHGCFGRTLSARESW